MPEIRPLSEITRQAPEVVLKDLKSDRVASTNAGLNLVGAAQSFGLTMRDYLRLAIDPSLSDKKAQYDFGDGKMCNGYEAALAYLNLPTRANFDAGITMELAGDTFGTQPGTRAMFPEVIDDMVRWQYAEDPFETPTAIVAQSRTISAPEMISIIVPDEQSDYETYAPIAEGAPIPVHSIYATDQKVRIGKFGGGYEFTYEFGRRCKLDVLTPYLIREQAHIQRSKLALATGVILNGEPAIASDGVQYHGPLTPIMQSSYAARIPVAAGLNGANLNAITNGQLNRYALLAWFVDRAKAGFPIDTVMGNYDSYFQWLTMFSAPILGASANGFSGSDLMKKQGFEAMGGLPIISGMPRFAISSTMPEGQLCGFQKAVTVEELIEAGSQISESERSVRVQKIAFYKTENAGYRIPYGNARSLFDYTG